MEEINREFAPKTAKEKLKEHITEFNKECVRRTTNNNTQIIRLAADVFFIGPLLIYAGVKKSGLPGFVRFFLVFCGMTTIYYNAQNFIQIERMLCEMKKKQKETEQTEENAENTENTEKREM